MGRRKRSEKAGAVAIRPTPAPIEVPARVGERMVSAICPLCGRTIPEKRAIKMGYVTVDKVGYFEGIEWDPEKPFGVVYEAGGRGSLRNWQYISPEDAPELFEALKARFIQALREWINKGWLTEEDLL